MRNLENLLEQIKNSKQITPNKVPKLSATRSAVRVSALLEIIENYLYIMEFWNGCLVNENLAKVINPKLLFAKVRCVKLIYSLGS